MPVYSLQKHYAISLGNSVGYLASTLPNFQDLRRQRKTEKLSQTRKDWGDMMTKCREIHWMGF